MPSNETIEIELELGALTFSAEDRTASGLLLPFGEFGRTSVGRLIVGAGAIAMPRDPSVISANIEHDPFRNVARATDLHETEAGIYASYKIADTPDGDDLIAQIQSGNFPHLSVELAPGARITQGGNVVSARLTGSAFVSEPAFESAAIYASANYVEVITDKGREFLAGLPDPEVQPTQKEESPMPEEITPTPEAAAVVVPEAISAAAHTPAARQPFGTKREFLGAMARRSNGSMTKADMDLYNKSVVTSAQPNAIYASLTVTDFAGGPNPSIITDQPQYLGELTELVYGQTAFADLVSQNDLVRPEVKGFHWATLPTLGTGASTWASSWAGNAAAVPSVAMTTTTSTASAKYFAGGFEAPVEWSLFGVDETLLGKYYSRQAQNFGLFVDTGVFTVITAGLTAFEADNPSGIDIGVGWSALVDALFAVITQKGGLPTAAVIEPTLWKSMAKIPQIDAIQYLTANLGLTTGDIAGLQIRPDFSGQLSTGNILAGNFKDGASLYTLPGSPLRFQALNISSGGAIDTAVVGGAAVLLEEADCFALVEPYSA